MDKVRRADFFIPIEQSYSNFGSGTPCRFAFPMSGFMDQTENPIFLSFATFHTIDSFLISQILTFIFRTDSYHMFFSSFVDLNIFLPHYGVFSSFVDLNIISPCPRDVVFCGHIAAILVLFLNKINTYLSY